MMDPVKVEKKLREWSEVTRLALILQKEAFKAGLNDLSIKKRLHLLGYTDHEITSNPVLKSLVQPVISGHSSK